MYETSKSLIRRSYDKRFATRWLIGDGIDIGAGHDSIGNYMPLFPLIRSVRAWDRPDGDAMLMEGVADASFDFVHSSHCLEHLVNPTIALQNWVRICKPGGHLLILVPDEDLYEQGVWPSTFNTDHKWSFTIGKPSSWCPQSVNVIALLRNVWREVDILKVELLDSGYIYGAQRFDQTLTLIGECAIEIVLRRKLTSDAADSP
jgi:SAM-dependent methyltransferase